MTKKIFRAILLVAAAVLLASLVIVMGCVYGYYRNVQEAQLKDELQLASYAVEREGSAYLERLRAGLHAVPQIAEYRFTWVAEDGTVLFDTAADAGGMANHNDRAEIREAREKGESGGVRYSATLTEQTMYYARALEGGTVLRISISQVTVFTLVLGMLRPILVVAVLAVILSAVLAHCMAKKIVRPLNALNLDEPLSNDAYEELSPLLRRIQQQRRQIDAQMQTLRERADELVQITGHMSEGLVLLDRDGKILSINPAAQRIFDVDETWVGKEFLLVDRSPDMGDALRAAAEKGHGETRGERGGREYQFDASRIESGHTVMGTVLLAFDITEQAAAERARQEFTANVSHELKTPLQSIMGSAELLENGLVKEEDMAEFFRLIRREAARLVTLVEDILHLSRLDEGEMPAWEEVDLYETAKEVAADLQKRAGEKDVRLTVSGEAAGVYGVHNFLYELLYNLCDNAIKYNVEGGRVEIIVSREGDGTVVRVEDTGIGIPPEYCTRVFERFFRVDKSRSKASGGTGLGLSIVKHIAQDHHASIELTSRVGEGTRVTVLFPERQK